jgi:thioredoxin reductase/bacterioferritin-associated ferredoxin
VENDDWLLTLYGPQAPQRLQAQALILATGAYDRPIAFPGWTLPGVMTAGAVQTLLKNQRVLPGQRFLLTGTGPLQLAVAAQLIRAGAEVVEVLEGASLVGWRTVRHALALWGQGTRLAEGWDYWRTLRRSKVPFRFGWSAVEAQGEGQVQEVVIARLDDAWRPIRQSQQTIAVDTLVIGYGFIPAVQLSGLLGCRHDFRPERGGYVPRRNGEMQTSLPGVYAVGDGAGIGGAALAQVEGHIAGLAAARQVGQLDEGAAQAAIARQRAALARERRFARMLGDLFTPGPGLYALATEETLICRCEEMPLAEIHQAIAAGARSANEVKGLTRCGMGNCQGRICEALLARAIATKLGPAPEYLQQVEAAGSFTPRPPLYPLPLTVLAEAAEVVGDELENPG